MVRLSFLFFRNIFKVCKVSLREFRDGGIIDRVRDKERRIFLDESFFFSFGYIFWLFISVMWGGFYICG